MTRIWIFWKPVVKRQGRLLQTIGNVLIPDPHTGVAEGLRVGMGVILANNIS